MLEATGRCNIFFVEADGSSLGDAGSGGGGLRERHLETERGRAGDGGLRERQKERRVERRVEGEAEGMAG
ncbi:hypothetical protein CMV_015148 [Castanea mollissima]|uniref:Uncharacterized protein n=1 Tax=Castanea mollissima TaxID=60419 RepID=A0A8J4VT55_9ROSI|nr:hypothetical protein CMV_015148 [Castanea mollissima]